MKAISELSFDQIKVVQDSLKTSFGIEFFLYTDSTDEEYPIDLRTQPLDWNNNEEKLILTIPPGINQIKNLIRVYEKPVNSHQSILIVKVVNPTAIIQHAATLYIKRRLVQSEPFVDEVLAILKESFPDNLVIQNLIKFNGQSANFKSQTSPYLHIRNESFHDKNEYFNEALLIMKTIQSQMAKEGFNFTIKKQTLKQTLPGGYFFEKAETQITQHQIIINLPLNPVDPFLEIFLLKLRTCVVNPLKEEHSENIKIIPCNALLSKSSLRLFSASISYNFQNLSNEQLMLEIHKLSFSKQFDETFFNQLIAEIVNRHQNGNEPLLPNLFATCPITKIDDLCNWFKSRDREALLDQPLLNSRIEY